MNQASGRAGRTHVLRLGPGADVRAALAAWCEAQAIEAAGIVSAVGSLSEARLRFAGATEAGLLREDLEVIACSGTLARHGLHVHLSVADREGRMTGGHLMPGCLVRTTLELVVLEVDGVRMRRTPDPATGFLELDPGTL